LSVVHSVLKCVREISLRELLIINAGEHLSLYYSQVHISVNFNSSNYYKAQLWNAILVVEWSLQSYISRHQCYYNYWWCHVGNFSYICSNCSFYILFPLIPLYCRCRTVRCNNAA